MWSRYSPAGRRVDTVAGWTGRNVYLRLLDPRYRFTSIWLDASDVKRLESSWSVGPERSSVAGLCGNASTVALVGEHLQARRRPELVSDDRLYLPPSLA
jgi:hypothetical protein